MTSFFYYFLSVLLFTFFLKCVCNRNKSKLPPSPLALPIIGHLHLIKSYLDHLTLTSLSTQYGPIFSLRLGYRSFLFVSSPSLVKECYTKNDMSFIERPKCLASAHFTFNHTLVAWAPYGHTWKTIRRLLVEEVVSAKSIKKSAIFREKETQTLVRLLLKSSKNGSQKVSFEYLISTFVCNVAMKLVAGKCYVKEEDFATEIAKNNIEKMRSLFLPSILLNICDYLPILKLFRYKGIEKNIIEWQERKIKFVQDSIDDVRHQNTSFDDSTTFMNEEKTTTLIGKLLLLQKSDPDFYTDDIIKGVLVVMFLTVTLPTSDAIESAMSLLLTHPSEMHKLRREIDNVVGPERLLNESDLDKLPYLHYVMNETLRLYPPLPLLQPHCSTEECVVGGYDIPKGTILLVNAWEMQRDDKVWEEPNKFKPERFRATEIKGENFSFVPFGRGRRGCPGEDLGLRMMLLALGALVQCFDWKLNTGKDNTEMGNISIVTVGKDKPLETICTPRKLQFLSHL